jgi:hypothetical protein
MDIRQDGCDAWVRDGGYSSAAMRERLVQQGLGPMKTAERAPQVWGICHSLAAGHDPDRFRSCLGLPDDPTAMTLEQLDELIAYHDALDIRYTEAVARLGSVRDQIQAAMREYGAQAVGDLRGTDAAPLRAAWTDAFPEYNWCCREIEAIGVYAERLEDEDG